MQGVKRKKLQHEALERQQEEAAIAAAQHDQKQKELKQQGIKAGLKTSQVDATDKAIAKFFYAAGISFSAADNSLTSYYRSMVLAIKSAPLDYVPPDSKKIGGPLLDVCYEEMWREIRSRDKDGRIAAKFGATYVSDGWDSIDHLPLINSAFVTSSDGGVYWRSVDTSGYEKNAEYCASLMIADIYEFGCDRVVLIITDTCTTMRKAWGIVMDEFPWMSVLPCQPHCVSLLLKDIGQVPKVAGLFKDYATVVNWFSHHQKPLAILRKIVMLKFGKSKELVRAVATRFGSHTLVGTRLIELNSSLQATVVDPDYVAHKYVDKTSKPDADGSVRECRGGMAKKLVLDDSGFWADADEHVTMTKPAMGLLRRHDSSAPTVGKVYNGWYLVGENIKSSATVYKSTALEKFDERWAYAHEAFAAAAYVVDPEFHGHDQQSVEEVIEGFMDTVEKIGILLEVRTKDFTNSWTKRKEIIDGDYKKQKTLEHYPSYPDANSAFVKQFAIKVTEQLAVYKSAKGTFARSWAFEAAKNMPAAEWWAMYGGSTPELQTLACLILSQPASSSIIERINSEFGFIKDRRRNRLAHDKANKLVALFHNLRLKARMTKPAYVETTVGWITESVNAVTSCITKWIPFK